MTNTSQRRALVVQSNTPFGNKLIQSGYINPEQLQQAIKTARPGQPLTEILESITGQPLPPELARQYKKQQLFELRIIHGVEAYDPEIEPMTTEELEAMLKFLETSLETCKRHRFIPLRKVESDPSSVLIAMVDPDNLTALEELRNQILRPQALKLQRRVITHLDKLITDQETLALVREIASRPFGLILVTGPTGSGKSTSLYSVLAERNDPAINISTAEDPIEYALPGITQCQVIREKNLTFANILRAFLRQDPDVLLVGETRDLETAKTSIEAALTGHLVLTTLHTNDAAGAIARLDEMGVEPFMVSAALLGILAQRLMRRVCGECRIPYTPTVEELGRYGLSASQEVDITFYKANTIPIEQRKHLADSGQLCKKCNGLGYKGRVGVYEFLKVTERLQTLITKGAPTEQIKEAAVEEGMKTILAYSLQLVREGYTTFEEVERVTFTDSGLEAELKAKRKQGLTCKSCEAELKPEWLDCPYCMTPRFTS